MQLKLSTELIGNYKTIISGFNRELFDYLKPPGAKINILEFTGSQTGDRVHIEFLFPIKVEWISIITDHGIDEKRAYFVDEGKKLPWPLKAWKHEHIVMRLNVNRSKIIDQINYSTGNYLADRMIWPVIYLSFYPRKTQYRRYFKNFPSK